MIEIVLISLFFLLGIVHLVAVAIFIFPEKKKPQKKYNPPISIIIPAHNEEKFIFQTLKSVCDSGYPGRMEIIVVDDGSQDSTVKKAREFSKTSAFDIRIFSQKHSGKANSINFALSKASYDTIVYIDADSTIKKGSLEELVQPLSDRSVAAYSGAIRVKYAGIFSWFQDVDYLVSSGWRFICGKVNATYVTPGFAAFRKSALEKIGGFSDDTLTEDIDVTIRLRKAGFVSRMSNAVIFTSVPSSIMGLVRQRMRWGRGSIQVAKKHRDILFSDKLQLVGAYSFPMHLFWYAFAILYFPVAVFWFLGSISLPLSIWTIDSVIKWFTLYGIIDLVRNALASSATSLLVYAIIFSWIFSFIFIALAMKKFGFTWRTLIAYVFIFPYNWLLMAVQGYVILRETIIGRKQKNRWSKMAGN